MAYAHCARGVCVHSGCYAANMASVARSSLTPCRVTQLALSAQGQPAGSTALFHGAVRSHRDAYSSSDRVRRPTAAWEAFIGSSCGTHRSHDAPREPHTLDPHLWAPTLSVLVRFSRSHLRSAGGRWDQSAGWEVHATQDRTVASWAAKLRVHPSADRWRRPKLVLDDDDVANRCLLWNSMREHKLCLLANARDAAAMQHCTFKPNSHGSAYLNATGGEGRYLNWSELPSPVLYPKSADLRRVTPPILGSSLSSLSRGMLWRQLEREANAVGRSVQACRVCVLVDQAYSHVRR